jgi:transposase
MVRRLISTVSWKIVLAGSRRIIDMQNLTPCMRNLVSMLWSEWKDPEQQIVPMNEHVEQIASSDPACQRLRQIPGIGPLVATAIVAAIGNGAAFHKG